MRSIQKDVSKDCLPKASRSEKTKKKFESVNACGEGGSVKLYVAR
jgi:hypothetical protein